MNPIEATPNPAVPDDVWQKLLSLPSESLPQRAAKPIKRLTALAHELATDDLLPDAGKKAHAEMHKVLDAARARFADEAAAARNSVLVVEGKTLTADLEGKTKTFDEFVADADLVVIEDAYRRAARVLSPDVTRTYAEYLASRNESAGTPEDALLDAHVDIAALGLVAQVKEYLDDEADRLAKSWLDDYRVKIKGLSDERQEVYRQIKEMSVDPQDIDLAKPSMWIVPTTAIQGDSQTPLPRFD